VSPADPSAEADPSAGAGSDAAAGPGVEAGAQDGAELALRRARAERAVRGAAAAALALEALTVLFVPRAIAQFGPGLTASRLALLLGLATALVVAAGLQRHRVGLVLGSVLQAAVIATGLLSGAMYVLGVLFGLAWLYLLRVRREVLRRWSPPAGVTGPPGAAATAPVRSRSR
jgi:hypothetical protein